jgi:NAD(P)H dehydrogenase (quinone)
MKHLIVYANHSESSFNGKIKDELCAALRAQGHETRIRNLYEQDFYPVLKSNDLAGAHQGQIPEEIKTEQDHVRWADVITFVYPIWWTGMPAIMKGYIDRVFLYGFAYQMTENGIDGMLKDKKVSIINTTGQPRDVYEQNGMYDAMKKTSDEGIFEFCGMQVIDHIFFPAVLSVDDETRNEYLEKVKEFTNRMK